MAETVKDALQDKARAPSDKLCKKLEAIAKELSEEGTTFFLSFGYGTVEFKFKMPESIRIDGKFEEQKRLKSVNYKNGR